MQQIKETWSESKLYRILLIAAAIYAVLRLVLQVGYLAMMLLPEMGIMGGVPDWAGAEGPMIPNDLQDYLDAAMRLQKRQDLYLKGPLDRVEFYQYSPTYALVFSVFLKISPASVAVLHTLIHIIAYILLYIKWMDIFSDLGLERSRAMLAWSLPVWLLFSAFWDDLGYLNIYTIMALLGSMLIHSVVRERLGWSLVWLSIILQTKPQWAFAAAVPLLLGRYRFFSHLIGLAVLVYIVISGVTLLTVGPAYGWQQYGDYVKFLKDMPTNFPWRGPEESFLGYNHSIKQIVLYLFGNTSSKMQVANLIKIVILSPLGFIGLFYVTHPMNRAGYEVPGLALDFALALYLAAFIWLDMVWELTLGIAIFPYLLGSFDRKIIKYLLGVSFLMYALLDPLRVGSFILGGLDIILPGGYVKTDLAIYFPVIMIVILVFYGLLCWRLGSSILKRRTKPAVGVS
jgi:hypothetical protein